MNTNKAIKLLAEDSNIKCLEYLSTCNKEIDFSTVLREACIRNNDLVVKYIYSKHFESLSHLAIKTSFKSAVNEGSYKAARYLVDKIKVDEDIIKLFSRISSCGDNDDASLITYIVEQKIITVSHLLQFCAKHHNKYLAILAKEHYLCEYVEMIEKINAAFDSNNAEMIGEIDRTFAFNFMTNFGYSSKYNSDFIHYFLKEFPELAPLAIGSVCVNNGSIELVASLYGSCEVNTYFKESLTKVCEHYRVAPKYIELLKEKEASQIPAAAITPTTERTITEFTNAQGQNVVKISNSVNVGSSNFRLGGATFTGMSKAAMDKMTTDSGGCITFGTSSVRIFY